MIDNVLVTDESGQEINIGDTVRFGRDLTKGTFQGVTRAPVDGKSGKVVVDGVEYYDRVFDLTISPLCAGGCGGVATVGAFCESGCDDDREDDSLGELTQVRIGELYERTDGSGFVVRFDDDSEVGVALDSRVGRWIEFWKPNG